MTTWIIGGLVLAGAFFVLVAAIGVLRLPDLPMRMHAATKAGTLGAGLLMIAVAVDSTTPGLMVRAIAVVIFLFLTAPIAASTIGRAALKGGITLWDRTVIDEYRNPPAPRSRSTKASGSSRP